jgi:protein-disulfide isomerase
VESQKKFYVYQHLVLGGSILSKKLLGIAFFLFLMFGIMAAQPGHAAVASLEDALSEKSMGKKDAPVTITEYSSLGCSHCAAFHRETLPKIKSKYIDTGNVRLVYNDMPFGTPALAAAALARCGGSDRFFGFIEVLFRSQQQWSSGNDIIGELARVGRFGGLSKNDVQTCLKNQELLKAIAGSADVAVKKHGVQSTPTFFINGTKIEGAQPFENFKKVIDEALEKAK